jgi:hypothetical protein
VGVYLWSGLHKFNDGFISTTFDKMLRELMFIENPITRSGYHFLGYLIPVLEVGLAIALVFKRTRNIAVFFGIAMHIIILMYLLKLGHNTVVYPWNLAMIFCLIILFYKNSNSMNFIRESDLQVKVLSGIVALFFILLPALSLFNLWDNYLSFKLYSGRTNHYCVTLPLAEVQKVDKELHPYLWNIQRVPNKYWIYLNKWSMDELNVPMYPATRVFKKVGKPFCAQENQINGLRFFIIEKDFNTGPYVEFGCEEVCVDCE